MINIQNIIENDINKLWCRYADEDFCSLSPLSISEVRKTGLVFIGINPSVTKIDKQKLMMQKDKSCLFHSLKDQKLETHQYFKKFPDIANQTKLDWSHLDILYFRETKQNKIKLMMRDTKGRDFIARQCQITEAVLNSVIDSNNPKIFVVANSLARDLLGSFKKDNLRPKQMYDLGLGFEFTWNDELGTYFYKNNPFFFTSMLTGRRALDKGSYQRLIWQIQFVKNNMKAVFN